VLGDAEVAVDVDDDDNEATVVVEDGIPIKAEDAAPEFVLEESSSVLVPALLDPGIVNV
jgi:hypothetical protein